jgi:predicted ATP-grasp superfamily ATP-dependent carboligase
MASTRVFVYEFITGGGMAGMPLPASLVAEGDMMLRSAAADLAALPGVEVITTRDARLPDLTPGLDVRPVSGPDDGRAAWARALGDADAVLPIAPETGGMLETLSRAVLAAGARLLGSHPTAVRVAASKLDTVRLLARAGLQVVPTVELDDPWPPSGMGWVVKPDDGAGCVGCRHGLDKAAVRAYARAAGLTRPVVQPYVDGVAGSACFLARSGQAWLLACNRQRIERRSHGFRLAGLDAGALVEAAAVLEPMVAGIAGVLPGLQGIIGADFILGPSGPVLLEVNPRLTTAYAGLHQALGFNPAEFLLGGHPDPVPRAFLPVRQSVSLDLIQGAPARPADYMAAARSSNADV